MTFNLLNLKEDAFRARHNFNGTNTDVVFKQIADFAWSNFFSTSSSDVTN